MKANPGPRAADALAEAAKVAGVRPPPQLDVISAAELLRTTIPDPRWAVHGMLPEGLAILAGAPKLGKSWLALQLGIKVASGGRVFGAAVEPGPVLFLGLEDSQRRLQDRIDRLADEVPASLDIATTVPQVGAGFAEVVGGWLDAHPDARMVVVDTLGRIRPPRARGEDIYQGDTALLGKVQQTALARHVCFLLVHHTRKGPTADPVDAVSGTAGVSGAADTILTLRASPKRPHETVLHVLGRDVERVDLLLARDESGGWTLANDSPAVAAIVGLSEERRRILDVLARGGKWQPNEVAKALGTKVDAAGKQLAKLVRDGLAVQVGYGLYSATGAPSGPSGPGGLSGEGADPCLPTKTTGPSVPGGPRVGPVGAVCSPARATPDGDGEWIGFGSGDLPDLDALAGGGAA